MFFSGFYTKARTEHAHDTRIADNYYLINIKLNVRKTLYEIFWGSQLEHDPHGYTVVQIS